MRVIAGIVEERCRNAKMSTDSLQGLPVRRAFSLEGGKHFCGVHNEQARLWSFIWERITEAIEWSFNAFGGEISKWLG
jgi:hypothetical protein